MPKIKTNRAAAKRFRKTASGKYKCGHANKSHILTKKATKRKRNNPAEGPCSEAWSYNYLDDPVRIVQVDAFRIDKTEVTNREYRACVVVEEEEGVVCVVPEVGVVVSGPGPSSLPVPPTGLVNSSPSGPVRTNSSMTVVDRRMTTIEVVRKPGHRVPV